MIIVAGDWRNVLKQELLTDAIQFINDAAKSARLVVVMPTPTRFDRDSFRKMQRTWFFDGTVTLDEVSFTEDALAREGNIRLAACCGTLTNVVFLDREDIFQVDGKATDLTRDKITYSVDGRHLSVHGSLSAAREFATSKSYIRLQGQIGNPASK